MDEAKLKKKDEILVKKNTKLKHVTLKLTQVNVKIKDKKITHGKELHIRVYI